MNIKFCRKGVSYIDWNSRQKWKFHIQKVSQLELEQADLINSATEQMNVVKST